MLGGVALELSFVVAEVDEVVPGGVGVGVLGMD